MTFVPNRLSSTAKAVQRHRISRKRRQLSEGALTKDFDLVRGKWRINASLPGYKVVGCAIEGLRHRLFPLRRVEASEFAKQVPFDERGEPIERPVMHAELVLLLPQQRLHLPASAAHLAANTYLRAARGNP